MPDSLGVVSFNLMGQANLKSVEAPGPAQSFAVEDSDGSM